MKKLLSILGAVGIVTTGAANVVSCGPDSTTTNGDQNNPNIHEGLYDLNELYNLKKADKITDWDSGNLDQSVKTTNNLKSDSNYMADWENKYPVFDLTEAGGGVKFNYNDQTSKWMNEPISQIILDELQLTQKPDMTIVSNETYDLLLARFNFLKNTVPELHYANEDENTHDLDLNNPEKIFWFGNLYTYVKSDIMKFNKWSGDDSYRVDFKMDITDDYLKDTEDSYDYTQIHNEDHIVKGTKGVNIKTGTYIFRLEFYKGEIINK
jgi:hypothetical protein